MKNSSALIFGHNSSGMGEKSLSFKIEKALRNAGYRCSTVDILTLLENDYEPMALLNYSLADAEISLFEEFGNFHFECVTDIQLILSWCFGVAALLATGVVQKRPTAIHLIVHHAQEKVLKKLYESAHIITTESLLANERAMTYGLDHKKILYLPHTYPSECTGWKADRQYVNRLAAAQGKSIHSTTYVIGCVSRLDYGKNCEFAVEAVRRLALKGKDIALVLKGDFPKVTCFPDYQPKMIKMLDAYSQEPWLLWDRNFTPYPDVLQEYASFDLLLHPSGAESGSHVVVECLGLKKPAIVLNCSTNPYLFKDVATFVQSTGELRSGPLPFYIPDMENLCQLLEKEIKPPDYSRVEERFHETALAERIPFLFEPDPEKICAFYTKDQKIYL